MSEEAATAEIRDPVHGYIYLSEVEREIIDTPVFQRLRMIRQLAGAHLTYPGAQHSRFEHSIGTLYLAGQAGRSLAQKVELSKESRQEMRLAALLHDVGHGPFSHLFEEVMTEKREVTHEDMTQRILKETEISDVLTRHGFSPEKMAGLALGTSRQHPQFMNDAVGGGLSVDIMDYLLRDSYFTGVEYGHVDVHRLLNSYEVVDDKLALDQAALYAFEAFIIARYEMFRAVYFHRTVRAAEIMIVRAMQLADDALGLTDVRDLQQYLNLTDEVVVQKLVSLAVGRDRALKQAQQFALGYRNRQLLKGVFEQTVQRKDSFLERIFSQKRIRDELAQEIARLAKVDSEDVHVDVPTTTSVPYTSAREALTSLTLVTKTVDEKKYRTVLVQDLPLIGAITGFFNIMRIYTTSEHRSEVEKAVGDFFGREGFMTKISV